MSVPLGVILLAAGEGHRLGGPKALAQLGERSFLDIAVHTISRAELGWISIVVGAEAERVQASLTVPPMSRDTRFSRATLAWVQNSEWAAGRTGSLQRGLATLPEWADGALIHQVDFPHVTAETFGTLASHFEFDPYSDERIFLPVHGGRRGHPILIGREIWPEIASLGPDEPLHAIVHRDAARICEVEVPDEGIFRNINTPSRSEES